MCLRMSPLSTQQRCIHAWVGVIAPSDCCNSLIHLFLTFYFPLHLGYCEQEKLGGGVLKQTSSRENNLRASLSLSHTCTPSSTPRVNSCAFVAGHLAVTVLRRSPAWRVDTHNCPHCVSRSLWGLRFLKSNPARRAARVQSGSGSVPTGISAWGSSSRGFLG